MRVTMKTARLGLWGKGEAMRTPIFDKQALETLYLDICEQIKDSEKFENPYNTVTTSIYSVLV